MNALLQHFDHIVDLLVIAVPAYFWLNKWFQRITIDHRFIRSVAKEHLPYIYHLQSKQNGMLGLASEHPNIDYIDLNGIAHKSGN